MGSGESRHKGEIELLGFLLLSLFTTQILLYFCTCVQQQRLFSLFRSKATAREVAGTNEMSTTSTTNWQPQPFSHRSRGGCVRQDQLGMWTKYVQTLFRLLFIPTKLTLYGMMRQTCCCMTNGRLSYVSYICTIYIQYSICIIY